MARHPGAEFAELREAAATPRAAADEAARAMHEAPHAHALADSAFALLDARGSLRLVTDAVHEDDTLCLALTCRPLRDALWARFPQVPCDRHKTAAGQGYEGVHLAGRKGPYAATTTRLRTRDAAVVATVARFIWALAQVSVITCTSRSEYNNGGTGYDSGCWPSRSGRPGSATRAGGRTRLNTARPGRTRPLLTDSARSQPGLLARGVLGVPQVPFVPRRGHLRSSPDRDSAIVNAPALAL
jgi:hypothetical protein